MTQNKPQKSGAPSCGLYYKISDNVSEQETVFTLRQIAMVINRASGYEKNMHVVEISAQQKTPDTLKTLVQVVQGAGLVAIIRDDFNVVKDTGADGVILSDPAQVSVARDAVGEESIIGLHCGSSQEKAQNALDAGVDYIALGMPNYGFPDVTLLRWWGGKTTKPVLALAEIKTAQTAGLIAVTGAGFVDATAYIDTHEQGVLQAVVNILDALS